MESKTWFCYRLTGCRRESPCSILVTGLGVCLESSLVKTGIIPWRAVVRESTERRAVGQRKGDQGSDEVNESGFLKSSYLQQCLDSS